MTDHRFATRQAASEAAADRVAELLGHRLAHQPLASAVVCGGTTPTECFEALSQYSLDWDRVRFSLSDERWVPNDHEDSNEKLIRDSLLVGKAELAELQPVYAADTTPQARCDELQDTLPVLPFSFSLIGVGVDGHFASLFPDADNLDLGLSTESDRLYVPVDTAASPHTRVSMTLAGISRADEVVLLIFGDDKLEIYQRAMKESNGFPVSRLLRQKRAPVRVFWAP